VHVPRSDVFTVHVPSHEDTQDSQSPSRQVCPERIFPENGVLGNYDPIQSELAEKPTFRAGSSRVILIRKKARLTEVSLMQISGSYPVPVLRFCAGVISTSALFVSSFQIIKTVQALTNVRVQAGTRPGTNDEVSQGRKPVLVELVTSEECAACRSAEQILTHLDRDQPVPNVDIIVLSESVKPHDPSAPSGYLSPIDPTRRQENYQNLGESSQPAPLFIINGVVQDAHVNTSEIEHSIESTLAGQVALRLTSVQLHGDTITFSLENGPSTLGYVNVYAALLDPMLSTKLPDEHGVEHTLTRSGVVEAFGRVGSSFRTKALGERPFTFQSHSNSLAGKRLVVFVQTKHIGAVLGSASCVLGRSMTVTEVAAPISSMAVPCPTLAE
jgi:hypothetical protein